MSDVEEKRSDISNSNIAGFDSEREFTKSKSIRAQPGNETGFFFCDIIYSDFYNFLLREIVEKEKIQINFKELYQNVKQFEETIKKKYQDVNRVKLVQNEEEEKSQEIRASLLKKY